MTSLPDVPAFDAGDGGAASVVVEFPDHVERLLAIARQRYGRVALGVGDRISRWWLGRSASPYLSELAAIDVALRGSGLYMLNLSYEWACTTGACPDPVEEGARLLRTLDWGLSGLGACVVVVRHESPVGPWLNVTWPGFVGALTIMAPGRFAAAINQPPVCPIGCGFVRAPYACDWIAAHCRLLRRTAIPPAHLLRKVAETAGSFEEAAAFLANEPICTPAFFTLSGREEHQALLIERRETQAFVHQGPVAVANHWTGDPTLNGHPRTETSRERHGMLAAEMAQAEELGWVRAPILNTDTRLAVVANARTGKLLVQGFEGGEPATRPTSFVA